MKITAVKTFVVDAYRANYVFVKITTDEGIHGVGEGTLEMREPTVAAAIDQLGDYLLGKDPFRTEFHLEMMARDSYWRTGPVLRSALAAVEAAMLDLKGKALGVPVYELLGGARRTEIRCYANGWFVGARSADEFAAKAVEAVKLGYVGLKWDPFGNHYMSMSRAERNACIEIVEAVRGAVGNSIDLMIEAHGRFDVPTSLAISRDLAPFDPLWLEEPLPPESIDALADVAARSAVPIATGERYYDPSTFAAIVEKRAALFLQPDVSHVGGVFEAKKIADIAGARFLQVCPHNPMGPIANAMTLQLAAAAANVTWLETMVSDIPWRGEVVREKVEFANGIMSIPSAPGLGVDIDEEACAAHPYQPHYLRHYNGSWTDIRPADAKPFYQTA